MPTIFIDTDNSNPDPEKKIYRGTHAGSAQFKAEEKMQKVVRKVLDKAADFTWTPFKGAKGYTLRLSVSKVDVVKPNTKTSMSGEILLYPRQKSMKKGEGEIMVSLRMTGSATASGTDERSVVDGVEAICEDLLPKALKVMREDYGSRYS
jgi:hypothetical protein